MKNGVLFVAALLAPSNAIPPPRIPDILDRINLQQNGEYDILVSKKNENDKKVDTKNENNDVLTLTYEQTLDHFPASTNSTAVTTFKQRYFYTSRYVHPKPPSSIITDTTTDTTNTIAFLCVGGEGPSVDESVLINSVHCTGDMVALAEKLFKEKEYDVHLFAIEHRFYGESFPTPPQRGTPPGYLRGDDNNEDAAQKVDLTHLSSRQAIQDIVSFIKSKEALQHFKLSNEQDAKEVRWITFGGSYPGMLSAWSHLLHPTTIFGAVSNSAPIQAELDFHQYHEHVGVDLENEEVGGSKECRKIIEEGHEQAVAILESQTSFGADGKKKKVVDDDSSEDGHGLERLALMFNICGGADTLRASRRNQEVFIGDGIITIPAQSNDPSCTTGKVCNIKGLCDTILTEKKNSPMKSSLDILGYVNQLQKKAQPGGGEQCTVVEWKAWLYFWKQDFTPTTPNVNDYSWVYQTCNEFGFYQTCNTDSNCPYGKGYHDIDRDLEICKEAFGIDADTVKQNVASTLTYYGGRSLTPNTGQDKVGPSSDIAADGENTFDGQHRLIFMNGDIDPWEELSFNDGTDITPSDSVQGASHHYWTQMIKETDSEYIVKARSTIYKTVTDWLEQPTHLVPIGGDIIETE